jgi:hypothetical protein
MNSLFIFNLVCGVFTVAAFISQMLLWIWCNEAVTAMLETLKKCDKTKLLESNAQKFAVFLAIREARVWDALMKQLGKRLAFVTMIPAPISLLWSLNSGVDLANYLGAPQSWLYASATAQSIELILLFFIAHNMDRFQKTYCPDFEKA